MKKLIAILLAVCMVLSLAACGGDSGSDATNPGGSNTPTQGSQGGGSKDPTTQPTTQNEPDEGDDPDYSEDEGNEDYEDNEDETTEPTQAATDLSDVPNPLGLNSLILAAYFENATLHGNADDPAEVTLEMIEGMQNFEIYSESWDEASKLIFQTYYVTNKSEAASEEDYEYKYTTIVCTLDFTPDLSGDALEAIWEDLKLIEALKSFGVSQIPIANLSGLAHHSELVAVSLDDVPGLTSLTGLDGAANLAQVTCRDCADLTDISALAALTGLTDISMDNCGISDLSVLTNLTKLETLSLLNCPVSDLSPLANLPELERLNICGTNVTALPAGGTTKLEYLDAAHSDYHSGEGLSDISHISEWLDEDCSVILNGCPVSELSGFAGSPEIEYLSLGNTQINNASLDVFQSISVEELSLGLINSDSHITDLSPLAGCTFSRLYLVNCNVTDLSPLLSCPNLAYLDLQASDVTDVSCLAAMPELKELYLGYTDVSDVSALAACPKLEYLSLRNCKNITDISALAASTSLKQIAVDYDAFEDLSAFEGTDISVG